MQSVNTPSAIESIEQQPPRRGWWGRNWIWAAPTLGCLLPTLACGGFGVGIVALVFGLIKSTDVYTESLAAARASTLLESAIGAPMEPSLIVGGNIEVEGSAGHADIAYQVSGPKGAATVFAVADKSAGSWRFTTLFAQLDSGERIPLTPQPSGSPLVDADQEMIEVDFAP